MEKEREKLPLYLILSSIHKNVWLHWGYFTVFTCVNVRMCECVWVYVMWDDLKEEWERIKRLLPRILRSERTHIHYTVLGAVFFSSDQLKFKSNWLQISGIFCSLFLVSTIFTLIVPSYTPHPLADGQENNALHIFWGKLKNIFRIYFRAMVRQTVICIMYSIMCTIVMCSILDTLAIVE